MVAAMGMGSAQTMLQDRQVDLTLLIGVPTLNLQSISKSINNIIPFFHAIFIYEGQMT